jgi:hypothetical protein
MSCKHRALLIITRDVRGTTSNLAKKRTELQCGEPEGHDGPHRDEAHGESWDDRGSDLTHILRDEDEDEA